MFNAGLEIVNIQWVLYMCKRTIERESEMMARAIFSTGTRCGLAL